MVYPMAMLVPASLMERFLLCATGLLLAQLHLQQEQLVDDVVRPVPDAGLGIEQLATAARRVVPVARILIALLSILDVLPRVGGVLASAEGEGADNLGQCERHALVQQAGLLPAGVALQARSACAGRRSAFVFVSVVRPYLSAGSCNAASQPAVAEELRADMAGLDPPVAEDVDITEECPA